LNRLNVIIIRLHCSSLSFSKKFFESYPTFSVLTNLTSSSSSKARTATAATTATTATSAKAKATTATTATSAKAKATTTAAVATSTAAKAAATATKRKPTEEPTENPPYLLPSYAQRQRVGNPTTSFHNTLPNSEGARNRVDRRKTYAGAHPIHVNNNTSETVPPTLQAQNAATG